MGSCRVSHEWPNLSCRTSYVPILFSRNSPDRSDMSMYRFLVPFPRYELLCLYNISSQVSRLEEDHWCARCAAVKNFLLLLSVMP